MVNALFLLLLCSAVQETALNLTTSSAEVPPLSASRLAWLTGRHFFRSSWTGAAIEKAVTVEKRHDQVSELANNQLIYLSALSCLANNAPVKTNIILELTAVDMWKGVRGYCFCRSIGFCLRWYSACLALFKGINNYPNVFVLKERELYNVLPKLLTI